MSSKLRRRFQDSYDEDESLVKKRSTLQSKKSKKKSRRETSSDSYYSDSSDHKKRPKKSKKKRSKSSKKKKKRHSSSERSDDDEDEEKNKELKDNFEPPRRFDTSTLADDEDKSNENAEENQEEKEKQEKEDLKLFSEVYEFNKNCINIVATPLNYDQPVTKMSQIKTSTIREKENKPKGVKAKFYALMAKLGENCLDCVLSRMKTECHFCFEEQKVYKNEKYLFQCINCRAFHGAYEEQKPAPKVVYQRMHCGFCRKIFKYKPGYSVYIDCNYCFNQNYYPLDMQPKQPVLVQQQRDYHMQLIKHQEEVKEKEKKEKEEKEQKKLKSKEIKSIKAKQDSDNSDYYSD